jgi:hypothetical protein
MGGRRNGEHREGRILSVLDIEEIDQEKGRWCWWCRAEEKEGKVERKETWVRTFDLGQLARKRVGTRTPSQVQPVQAGMFPVGGAKENR